MRKTIHSGSFILLLSTLLLVIAACNKEMSATNGTNTTGNSTSSSTSSTISVTTDSAGTDSVYILQPCDRGYFRDSIAQTALPGAVSTYLTANYAGYNFLKGFVIKDSAGTVGGYVVIISFNGKPVGLLFDASGNFQRVLEQRESGDIVGRGWHEGGRFDDRDGSHRDTIALSSLPSMISAYMTSNYPADTLLRTYLNRDSSLLVISKDKGLFATLFSSSGAFVKRVSLMPQITLVTPLVIQNIVQDSLPAAGLSLLSTIFPNYVFESAVSFTANGQLQGYAVIIDANNTKYAVWLNASGNLVAILPVW
jgi:hypothetical protein